MNYFKAAEQDLSALPVLKRSLQNLKNRRERLIRSGCPSEKVTMDYSKTYVNAHSANETLTELLEVTQVNREITETEDKVSDIECVLDQLDKKHKELLVMWYINKKSKEEIAELLNYEKRDSVYNLRNQAVAQFALLYYGAGALNSI